MVYSQFLRLRRIIIDFDLLVFRLKEMSLFFVKSDYPISLVNDAFDKIVKLDRIIEYRKKGESDTYSTSSKFEVPWVMGCYLWTRV